MAGKSILSRRSTLANVCGHTMIVVKLRTAVGLSQVSCHINHAQAGCRCVDRFGIVCLAVASGMICLSLTTTRRHLAVTL